MNEKVTQFISEAPEEHRKIMESIRALIHEKVPSAEESFKWSRPVYSSEAGNFAYLQKAKSYVSFGIYQHDRIKDHRDLLEGTGKNMRHLKIRKAEDLQPAILEKWLQQLTG